jgi:transcriptional regulator with XRE-family HTH domain
LAFRRFLADRGLTQAELARRAGLPSANSISNFLRGSSASLSLATMEAIVQAIPGATLDEISGKGLFRNLAAGKAVTLAVETPRTVPLLAETGRQPDQPDPAQPPRIPVPPGTVQPDAALYAVRVAGPGAERLYSAGSLLICQRLAQDETDLPDGSIVIVKGNRAGEVYVAIREVERFEGRLWLWPRSTHPEHHQPLPAPSPLAIAVRRGDDIYRVAGIVLATWQPEVPSRP